MNTNIDIPVRTFAAAKFGLYIPSDMLVDGILVLTPGSNEDGRKDILSPTWYQWAHEHNLATLGVFFQDDPPYGRAEQYCAAGFESGNALLQALLQYEIRFPQLIGKKLYMWGWSAGGQFNYEFNANYPDRVAAFVVNKGGVYYTGLAPERARANPGLFFLGRKDYPLRALAIQGIYAINMYVGANWVLEEEEEDHEVGKSPQKAKTFFEHILKAQRAACIHSSSTER